jgi:hypothetical protein
MINPLAKSATCIAVFGALFSLTRCVAAPLFVDLRTMPSGPVRYYVEFAVLNARSLQQPGHDTMLFVTKNSITKASSRATYGYYGGSPDVTWDLMTTFFGSLIPEVSLHGYMLSISIDLRPKSNQSIPIITEVDEKKYQAALALTQHWVSDPPNYALGSEDCTNYVEDIAATLGLRIPVRTVFNGIPPAYIAALKQSIQTNLHQTFPDGSTFTGTRVANVPEGICTVTTAAGSRYTGGFSNGEMSGIGVWSDGKGNKYSGSFSNGRPYGDGLARFADGTVIKGQFAGTSVFSATVAFPDHSKFIGALESGIAEGPGLFVSRSGQAESSEFHNGQATISGKRVCLPTTVADINNLSQLKFP